MTVRPSQVGRIAGQTGLDYLILLLGPTAIFFAPLATGAILIGGTDSLFTHLPNILVAAENTKTGGSGSWNPYILGGVDFSSTMHNHIANPVLSWIGLLSPSLVLPTFSLAIGLLWASTGILVMLALRLLNWDRATSVLLALIYEMGGLAWFGISNLSSFFGYVALSQALLGLTLVYKGTQRSKALYVSLGLILLALATIFTVNLGQPGHIEAYLLLIGAGVIITCYSIRAYPAQWILSGLMVAVVLIATMSQAFRLSAIVRDLIENAQELTATFSNIGSVSTYLLVTLVIPTGLGVNLQESLRLTSLVGGNDGRHIQFHAPPYIGAMLLIGLTMVVAQRKQRLPVVLLTAGVLLTLVQVITIQPITNVLQILAFPMHEIVPKTVGFVFLYASVALYLRAGMPDAVTRKSRVILGVVLGLACLMVVTLGFYGVETNIGGRPDRSILLLAVTKTLAVSISIITLGAWIAWRRLGGFGSGRWLASARLLTAARITSGAVVVGASGTMLIWRSLDVTTYVLLVLCSSAALAITVWSSLTRLGPQSMSAQKSALVYTLMLSALWFTAILCTIPPIYTARDASNIAATSIAGAIFAIAFVVLIVAAINQDAHFRVIIVVILTFVNLLGAQKVLTYVGSDGFISQASVFPIVQEQRPNLFPSTDELPEGLVTVGRLRLEGNFGQYRVGSPEFLGSPHGFNSVHLVQGIRAVGGAESYLSDNYIALLSAAGETETLARHGALSTQENEQFLDLLGVRYAARSDGQVLVRSGALSRVGFFSACLQGSGMQEDLRTVLDPTFDLRRTAVVGSTDCDRELEDVEGFEPLSYESPSNDLVVVSVQGQGDGWLWFGDLADSGWTAIVDGRERDVQSLNGVFMGVQVFAGDSSVELRHVNSGLDALRATTAWMYLLLVFAWLVPFGLFWWTRRQVGFSHPG